MQRLTLLLLVVTLPIAGCYGVPEDTRVQALRAQAWGGVLPECYELKVDLDLGKVAVGVCESVDVSNGVALPPETVAAIRSGIDESEIRAENVEPDPSCPSCPTRAYRVMLASESADMSQEMRIIPSSALSQTLTGLGAP